MILNERQQRKMFMGPDGVVTASNRRAKESMLNSKSLDQYIYML